MSSALIVKSIAVAVLLPSIVEASDGLSDGYVSLNDLTTIRQRLRDGDAITTAAFTELIRKADAGLTHKPQAMAKFNVPAFYGEQQTEHSRMKNLLSDDSAAAFHLALAAASTSDERVKQRYADHAARILDEQIEPDGSMPHEIGRGKRSLWYTYFALAPLTVAIDIARDNDR